MKTPQPCGKTEATRSTTSVEKLAALYPSRTQRLGLEKSGSRSLRRAHGLVNGPMPRMENLQAEMERFMQPYQPQAVVHTSCPTSPCVEVFAI